MLENFISLLYSFFLDRVNSSEKFQLLKIQEKSIFKMYHAIRRDGGDNPDRTIIIDLLVRNRFISLKMWSSNKYSKPCLSIWFFKNTWQFRI